MMRHVSIIVLYYIINLSFATLNGSSGKNGEKPHIVIIMADDLGWNDVSFHGSNQIPTPNIDALAYNGVILNNYYTSAVCTPSRASLLTGKYAVHLGMQHAVLLASEPRGLPLEEKLLPQYLKEAGYSTHLVGKWHLGFFKSEYTPLFRGFDSHFGFWNGHQDYYNHNFMGTEDNCGFDMRRNNTVALDTINQYSTDLFTNESVRLISSHDKETPFFLYLAHAAAHSGNPDNLFQAPDEEIRKFGHIDEPERRIYAAMVSKLDESVGRVVAALREQEMLDNSIIVFMSDNGAMTFGVFNNRGSNYPLRGMKASGWEGGVRAVAAVWSPLINKTQRVSNQLMHVTDWLPTFLSAAGLETETLSIDGHDMWQAITNNTESPRTEVLINIDEISNYSVIRVGDYKYVTGDLGDSSDWYGDSDSSDKITIVYNLTSVMESEVAMAINTMKTDIELGNPSEFPNVLMPDTIRRLRLEATVHCDVNGDEMIACLPKMAPCLFNIKDDPCEMKNIIDTEPNVAKMLEEHLKKYQETALPAANLPEEREGDAKNWGGVWVSWRDAVVDYNSSIQLQCGTLATDSSSDNSPVVLYVLGGIFLLAAALVLIWVVMRNTRGRVGRGKMWRNSTAKYSI